MKYGPCAVLTSLFFRGGMGNSAKQTDSHPSKKLQGCETCRMRRFPLLFCAFFHGKGGENLADESFPLLLPEKSSKKGGENCQLRGFHILRVFGRDGKTRKINSFPSFAFRGGMGEQAYRALSHPYSKNDLKSWAFSGGRGDGTELFLRCRAGFSSKKTKKQPLFLTLYDFDI